MKQTLLRAAETEIREFYEWSGMPHQYSDAFMERFHLIIRKNNSRLRIRPAALIIAAVFAVVLAACAAVEPVRNSIIENITKITNIYDPVECAMPERYYMPNNLLPFYNEFSGTLSVIGKRSVEVSEGDEILHLNSCSLFTFSLEGELISESEFLTESSVYVSAGDIGHEDFVLIEKKDGEATLTKRSLADGSLIAEMDIGSYNPTEISYYRYLVRDGWDNILTGNAESALLFSNEMELLYEVYYNSPISSPVCGDDGMIYALSSGGSVVRFDKDIRNFEAFAEIDETAENIGFALHTEEGDAEYDFYYTTHDALYGVHITKDGTKEELLLDYKNSGIVNTAELRLQGLNANGYSFSRVLSEEIMIFSKTTSDGCLPVLYKSADDIELADVSVIEFAHCYPLEDNIFAQLLFYDQKEKGVSIIVHDYSRFNSRENPDGGARMLMNDILTGAVSPDIVFGNPADIEIRQLVEKKLYTDLMPYFESDKKVNPDTVFGCVQNAFTSGDGELWGMTPFFALWTILSTNEILGEYADGDTWTLEEFLDFAEQYGSKLMFYLTKEFAAEYMENVYGMFCDTEKAVCTFDSPLFERYLEFLNSLPSDEEYDSTELGQVPYADWFYYHRDGIVPLYKHYAGEGMGARYRFGTDDFKMIGFPTDGDTGAVFYTRMAFVVTDKAENPEACWDFIKAFMHTSYGIWMHGSGTTAMKDLYTEMLYSNQGKMIRRYEDGTYSEDEDAKYYESMGITISTAPYILEEWDEESTIKIIEYLDNEGMRLSDKLPSEVNDIIYEEMSAYFAGMGDAGECADKIQSRVSIWLSERYG